MMSLNDIQVGDGVTWYPSGGGCIYARVVKLGAKRVRIMWQTDIDKLKGTWVDPMTLRAGDKTEGKAIGSRAAVEHFRDWCIKAEAAGNHGTSHPSHTTIDDRRDICFHGEGRGWQLTRIWRSVWAKRFPQVELPPAPAPKPRGKYIGSKKLRGLWNQLKSLDDTLNAMWWEPEEHQWMGNEWMTDINRYGEEYEFLHEFHLGENTNEAYETIQRCIAKYLKEHNLSGQEPQIAEQSDLTGNEPMIGRTFS